MWYNVPGQRIIVEFLGGNMILSQLIADHWFMILLASCNTFLYALPFIVIWIAIVAACLASTTENVRSCLGRADSALGGIVGLLLNANVFQALVVGVGGPWLIAWAVEAYFYIDESATLDPYVLIHAVSLPTPYLLIQAGLAIVIAAALVPSALAVLLVRIDPIGYWREVELEERTRTCNQSHQSRMERDLVYAYTHRLERVQGNGSLSPASCDLCSYLQTLVTGELKRVIDEKNRDKSRVNSTQLFLTQHATSSAPEVEQLVRSAEEVLGQLQDRVRCAESFLGSIETSVAYLESPAAAWEGDGSTMEQLQEQLDALGVAVEKGERLARKTQQEVEQGKRGVLHAWQSKA